MGLSNKLSCETGSFSHHLNPHRFFQSEVLRLCFSALELRVAQSILLPRCSSLFIHIQIWDPLLHQPPPCWAWSTSFHPHPPVTVLLRVLSAWLPVSAPPTGLDECFFFNSLAVRLTYRYILSILVVFCF